MSYRIIFPERNVVALEQFELGPTLDDSVRIRTLYSLVSAGTEGIVLRGMFDPGTHWAKWVTYPFQPGYSVVGVVDEIGCEVTDFAVGDRVAARVGHATEHVVPARLCTRIQDEIPLDQACWFGLAKIALMGARAAEYRLGDTVVVIGAGPIGQMSVRWAVASGAGTVVVVDPIAPRLDAARRGGAHACIAAPVAEAHDQIIAACGGTRPRIVIDSTGNAAVFAAALGLIAEYGRLVLLGDTGSPVSQHLTEDVIVRGLTIVGAHDRHSTTTADWDGDRGLHELFFRLACAGRFHLEGLNTHTFTPNDCEAAYALAIERSGEALGIVFDWTEQ